MKSNIIFLERLSLPEYAALVQRSFVLVLAQNPIDSLVELVLF